MTLVVAIMQVPHVSATKACGHLIITHPQITILRNKHKKNKQQTKNNLYE